VVAKPDLAHLPLGLAWREGSRARRPVRHLDALRLQHLVEADDEGLDLGLLASERERPAPAFGKQEEAALAGLADRRHRYVVNRVELEYGHTINSKSRGGIGARCKSTSSGGEGNAARGWF